jgi:hypothetical protein
MNLLGRRADRANPTMPSACARIALSLAVSPGSGRTPSYNSVIDSERCIVAEIIGESALMRATMAS